MLLPETPEEGAAPLTERIRAAIADHSFEIREGSVSVTVNIGVFAQSEIDDLEPDTNRRFRR